MANDALLHVRIDPKIKAEAEKIIKRLGISHSDAVRMYYSQIVEEKGIPFRSHIPNAESRKAIAEALTDGGEVITLADLRKQWDNA